MNTREDEKWQSLLSRCAPTFAGDAAPPYGFMTGTLARLRADQRRQEEWESIGWRALLASLAALVITAGVTFSLQLKDGGELEPGVRTILQVENVPVS